MTSWEQIVEFVERLPVGVWVALAVANIVVTIATWSAAGRRMRRAGERIANPQLLSGRAKAKDTALTVTAMIPAALFWAMVLAGSFHGLVAFGRDAVGWHDGWEYLVPGTLDGVSVTFAFLAFRAVRKEKAPDRCRRVVWGAALASAVVNFAYEYSDSGHNPVASGYLALLSLFGMVMFHEFLDQFEEGTGDIKRKNPPFGLRWVTWPTNTFCAAVAWHNHPPAEGTPATVRGPAGKRRSSPGTSAHSPKLAVRPSWLRRRPGLRTQQMLVNARPCRSTAAISIRRRSRRRPRCRCRLPLRRPRPPRQRRSFATIHPVRKSRFR